MKESWRIFMGLWLRKMEQKYGKFAIPNITMYLLICYAVGYVIQLIYADFFQYLTLNPYEILHGQIWRIVTWLVVPPDSLDFFTLIMLYFYYSIGTTLERTWGTFAYNVYLISGMVFTIVGAFIQFVFSIILTDGFMLQETMVLCSNNFSTYYICMSIILAFSMTFPENQILIMFVLPLKMKVLGIVYAVMLGIQVMENIVAIIRVGDVEAYFTCYYLANINAIVFSLLNAILFFVTTRKNFRTPKQHKRQQEYKKQTVRMQTVAKHKCAICGRTAEEHPELEFRFCSKCDGNYEYCSDHLFTHQHVQNS